MCRLPAASGALPAVAAPSAAFVSSSRQQRSLAAAAGAGGGIDLSALGLEIPDIDASDIATYQQELGAEFDVRFGRL